MTTTLSDNPHHRRTLQFLALFDRPMVIAALVFLVGLGVIVAKLQQNAFDPRSFAHIDGAFVTNLAHSLPSLDTPMDIPAYRAQRILLPALAALFRPFADWALIAINLTALTAGTYALSRLARLHGSPAALGLAFGLWFGALFAIQLNLTEVLAYSLVLWAILCWERKQLLAAGIFCGLAMLAKEMSLLYAVAFLPALLRQGWRERLAFPALAFSAGVLWQLVLIASFGESGLNAKGASAGGLFPFVGLLNAKTAVPGAYVVQLIWVLLPATIACCWGVALLVRDWRSSLGWALLLNGLLIISLPAYSADYLVHSARLCIAANIALLWAIARTGRPLVTWATLIIALAPLIYFQPGYYF